MCLLQDPQVLPHFPYISHEADALSVATEVDYLYKEEGRALLNSDSLSSLINSLKSDEKAIESPKLIMDRFLNGCQQRVWESSHESLPNAPPSQEQNSSKPNGHCEEHPNLDTESCEVANPRPTDSQSNCNSHNVTAQHYTIPLQTSHLPNAQGSLTEHYIPSGSSGYGTSSDHYFESGSSTFTGSTNDYFKSRLADVAECNSLSTCGEEETQQTTIEITKLPRDTCHCSRLECTTNSNPEVTTAVRGEECPSKASRPHLVLFPLKGTESSNGIDTMSTNNLSSSMNCEFVNRRNSLCDYTQSSIPPEHYFTDDEGYLRFSKETAV